MGKFSETITIEYPHQFALNAFNDAIDFYVAKVLADTSSTAKKLTYAASGIWANQSLLMAGLTLASLKTKDVRHPAKDQSVITIPSSTWTYGGLMTVTLLQGETPEQCKVEIVVKTQGLRSKPAREAGAEFADFMQHRFAEFAEAHNQAAKGARPIAEDIQSLADLKARGLLSEDEFVLAKTRLLGGL